MIQLLISSGMDSNISNTTIYLDLGAALAAFGLIFAVYQLINPLWKITLSVKPWWQQKSIWIFGGIGLFFTLIAVIVNVSHENSLPYEIIAFLAFILSPLSLFLSATKIRNIFNDENSRTFYHSLVSEISSSDDKKVDAALELLLCNFEAICKAARDKSSSPIVNNARAILDVILSEEVIVKIFTTKRLDALQYVFTMLDKYDITPNISRLGFPALMRNLLLDEKSFFYKHLDQKSGLALSSDIYRTVFDSKNLLSTYNIFGYPTLRFFKKEPTLLGTKVVIESLSRLILKYLKGEDIPVRYITDGFEYLDNTFRDVVWKVNPDQKNDDNWWILHEIVDFIGREYTRLGQDEKQLSEDRLKSEKELDSVKADYFNQDKINPGAAALMYRLLTHLGGINSSDYTYHLTLQLLDTMIHNSFKLDGFQKLFEDRVWIQISKNVIGRHYPNALRPYLVYMGFLLSADTTFQRDGWEKQEMEKIRRLLYIDLKPLFESNEKMVDDTLMKDILLPDNLEYKDGKFIYKHNYGINRITEIAEPQEGSESTLKDISPTNEDVGIM